MRARRLAEFLGARILGDPDREITGVASLSAAGPSDLSFVQDARYLNDAAGSRAGVLVVGDFAPEGVPGFGATVFVVSAPRLAFARAAGYLASSDRTATGVHHTAVVDASAKLSSEVSLGAYAVVGRNVRLGRGTRIGPGCALGEDVTLGE